MRFFSAAAALAVSTLTSFTLAQSGTQFEGKAIPNSLPSVPGAEIAYFNYVDKKGRNLTLTNYVSKRSNNNRLTPSSIKRMIIIVHGQNRDPGTYMAVSLTRTRSQGRPELTFLLEHSQRTVTSPIQCWSKPRQCANRLSLLP